MGARRWDGCQARGQKRLGRGGDGRGWQVPATGYWAPGKGGRPDAGGGQGSTRRPRASGSPDPDGGIRHLCSRVQGLLEAPTIALHEMEWSSTVVPEGVGHHRAWSSRLNVLKSRSDWAPGPDVRVVDAEWVTAKWLVSAISCGSGICPGCAVASSSRHTSYIRQLQDLPEQGREVVLRIPVQRCRCRNPACGRQTFAGRLPEVTEMAARRTNRVANLMRLLGHATGGRPPRG
jgi:zinc-finger of transposase IS204/IS1001/IS1096/IS1165